ncbi:MAG: anhydro-N-acetylmuramic acid kinase, partial [Pseudomonadota bacterium]
MNSHDKAADRVCAVGLMSGTSMDGIDIAAITTDGHRVLERHGGQVYPYPDRVRAALSDALETAWRLAKKTDDLETLGQQITRLHADAVRAFLADHPKVSPALVGFHGHTVLHQPHRGLTWQIGDGQLLADLTQLPTVWDMRSHDVARGGQGAPLACAYHAAIAGQIERPAAVLNLGGVANVTWIGADADMLAMDCGPANALMDMWVEQHGRGRFDESGKGAAAGAVRADVMTTMADNPYFDLAPPKSLDRLDFDLGPVRSLPYEDGLATLAAFTVEAVWMAQTHFPEPVRTWLVTGGGRHNPTLMAMLSKRLSAPVKPIDEIGFDGDLLEAEAFA